MPKFRKRPVEIEAIQWTGSNVAEVIEFLKPGGSFEFSAGFGNGQGPMYINTLEGRMETTPGSWIIRGIAGEYYSCKPDIFEKTYEAV